MAIFISSTKSISRGKGQSAVASASYRAGEKLEDERYGKTHDYSNKDGVISAHVILPSVIAGSDITITRNDLWNMAETAEKRKDARVAREWLVNLPHELSAEDRQELAHTFAQTLADRYGTIADCAIHEPSKKEIDRGADPRNFHAHIMFTTRTAALDANNEIILTDKASIELSDTKRYKLGMERVDHEITEVRQLWEQIVNEKLAEHNHELIDSRSYAEQGLDIKPQLKMGSVATKLERDAYVIARKEALDNEQEFTGIAPVTIRGEINAMIAERNQLVAQQEHNNNHIMFKREYNNERRNETARAIEYAEQAIEHISDRNTEAARAIEHISDRRTETARAIEYTEQAINNISDSIDSTKHLFAERSEAIEHQADPSPYDIDYERAFFERKRHADRAINDISDSIDSTKHLFAERSEAIKHQADPSPYDIDYERAFFERKRRADRALRESIRVLESAKLGNAQRVADVEDAVKTLAYRLLERRKQGLFDSRQLIVLDDFARSLGINENKDSDIRKNAKLATDKINTVEVLENNPHVFRLLNFPSQEREHHQTVTADFYRFIAHIDKQRAERTREYQAKLGSSDTSRVTAEILTVEPYLAALTKYVNNTEKTDESRALAEQHINKTLRLTAKQYKIVYNGLNTLDSNESVQKHVRELELSLSTFAANYAERLTQGDFRSINDSLKLVNNEIKISNINDDDFSPDF